MCTALLETAQLHGLIVDPAQLGKGITVGLAQARRTHRVDKVKDASFSTFSKVIASKTNPDSDSGASIFPRPRHPLSGSARPSNIEEGE
jgi:hypothetical protein